MTLRIATWDVDGFSDPAQRLSIVAHLWKLRVDIAVLTESHLLDEDIFLGRRKGKKRIPLITIDHYKIAHWHNRESTVKQRCGGVLILARPVIDVSLVPQELLPWWLLRPVSCCPMVVEAVGGCSQPFRHTGLYIPPSPTVRARGESVATILTENSFSSSKGQRLNHLICGDLNPTGWREQFEEWLGETGLLMLNDPQFPTFPSGNTLDYILLMPGDVVWEAVMPFPLRTSDAGEGGGYIEEHFFPASVLPPTKPNAHSLIQLDLPFVEEPKQPRTRSPFVEEPICGVLSVKSLEPEEWGEYDVRVRKILQEEGVAHNQDCKLGNARRIHQRIIKSIKVVLENATRWRVGLRLI